MLKSLGRSLGDLDRPSGIRDIEEVLLDFPTVVHLAEDAVPGIGQSMEGGLQFELSQFLRESMFEFQDQFTGLQYLKVLYADGALLARITDVKVLQNAAFDGLSVPDNFVVSGRSTFSLREGNDGDLDIVITNLHDRH
ncbi:hypothetical protein MYX84_09410 [Acidobacteria bacterium AH-259-O06]|nr:hypothetical protein [Acidobacteria bacterium AH-259-O06]